MAFVFSSIGTESSVSADYIELVCVATRKDKAADLVRAGQGRDGSQAYELPPYHSIARVYVEGKPGAEVALSCAAGGVMLNTPRPFTVVLDASGKREIYLAGSACSFARTVRATPKADVEFGDVRVRLTLVPEPPVRVVSQATPVAELVAAVFVENVAWPVYELSPSVVPQGQTIIVIAPQTTFIASNATLTVAGGTQTASVDSGTGVLTFTGVGGLGSASAGVAASLKVFKTNAEGRTADTTVPFSIVVAPVPTAVNGVLSTLPGSGAYNTSGSGTNTYFVRSDIVADLTFTLDRAVYGISPWPWKDTLRDIVVVENNGVSDTRRSVRATPALDAAGVVTTTSSGAKVVFTGYKPVTAGCTSVKFEFVTAAGTFVSPAGATFAVLTPPTIASAVLTVESSASGTYVNAGTYLVRGDKVRLTCELSSAALDGQTVTVTIGASSPTCVIGTGGASAAARTFYVDYTVVGAGQVACSANVNFSGGVALAMPMATGSLDLLRNAGNIYGAPTTAAELGTVTAWTPPGGGSPWARVNDTLATTFGFTGLQTNAAGGKSLDGAGSVAIKLFMMHKTSAGGGYDTETQLTTTVATNAVTASAVVPTAAHGVEFVLKVLSSTGRVIMTTARYSTIATVYALPSIAFTLSSVSSLYGTGVAFVRGPESAGEVMTSKLAFGLAVAAGQLSFPAGLASGSYGDYIHSVTSSGSNDLGIDIGASNPVFAANGLSLTIEVAPSALANIGNPTVTIVWKTAGAAAGSSTVMSMDSGCIQRVPTSLATSVWWADGPQSAVSAVDTVIPVTVASTGGDGFQAYGAGTTTLVPTVNMHMDAASAGTRQTGTTWTVTGVRPSSAATGASDATSTLTYSHTNGGTNWSYAYTVVALIPKAYIYLQPAAANVTWSKTSLDAAVPTPLTMSIAKPGGGTNADNVPLPRSLTLFAGGGNLTAGETYTAGTGGNPATVGFTYTSADDNVPTTFKVTVATPRGTQSVLTAPNVTSITTATALAFKPLFTVDGTSYLVTAESGTSNVALTRTGASLAARFAALGRLDAALSANTYDPGGSNTDIPLGARAFSNNGANGEFEVPAQPFSTKMISVTMRDTGAVVRSPALASADIYVFPTAGSVEFQNMASSVVTHLVLGTQYKAVRNVTGRKFPPVAQTSVVPSITNTSARAGVAIAQGATTVACTFTPDSQTLAPVCSGLAVTLANGALHTYSGWTAQMYTLPSFSVAAGNGGVSIASITANVPTDVTVTFTDRGSPPGSPLGNPVSLSNVFLSIGGTEFVATSFPTATSVTARVTTLLSARINEPISVVVKYPSDTGLSATVPAVGTVTDATINVATSPFPAYELAPSTVASGTTTLRLVPEIAFVASSATLDIGAGAVNQTSIDATSGVITFTVQAVTGNKNAVLYVAKTGQGNKTYGALVLTVTAGAAPVVQQSDLTTHGSSLAVVISSAYNTTAAGTVAYFARTDLAANWTFTFGTAPHAGSWKNTFTDIVVVETSAGVVVRNSLRIAATALLTRFNNVTVSGSTVVITGYRAPNGTATVSVEFIVGGTTINSPASGSPYSVLTPPTVTAVVMKVKDGAGAMQTLPSFLVRGDEVEIEFELSSSVFDGLLAGKTDVVITGSSASTKNPTTAIGATVAKKFTVAYPVADARDHTITASVDFSGTTVLDLTSFFGVGTALELLGSGATKIYGTPTQAEFDAVTASAPWTAPAWARVGDTLGVSYTYAGLLSTARTVGGKAPDGHVVKIWYKTKTAYGGGGSWVPASFASPVTTSVTAGSGVVASAAVAIPAGKFQIQFYVSVVNLCATPKATVTSAALSTIDKVYAYLPTITVNDSNNYGTDVVFVRGPDSATAFECKLNLSLGAGQLWLNDAAADSATLVGAHFASVACSARLGYTEGTPTVVTAVSVPFVTGALAGLSFELTKCKGDTASAAATNQTVTIVWKKADASAGSTTVVTIPAASIRCLPSTLSTNFIPAMLPDVSSHDAAAAADARLVAATDHFLPSAAGTISASAGTFLGGLSTVTVGSRRSNTEWDLSAVAISSAAVASVNATATVTYSHTYAGTTQWTYDYAATVIVPMFKIYVVPLATSVTLTLPGASETQTDLEANVATAGIKLSVAAHSSGNGDNVTITGVTDDVSGTVSAGNYVAGVPARGTFTYQPPNADGDVIFTVALATPRGTSVTRALTATKYVRMPSALALTTLFALTGASAVNYVATSVTGTLKATLTGATGSAGTPFWTGSTVSSALSVKYDGGLDLTGMGTFTGSGAGEFTIASQTTAGSKNFVATMARTKKSLTYPVVASTVYDFPVLDAVAAATVFRIGAGGGGGAVVTHLVAGTQYCCERTFKDGSAQGKFPPATASLGAGVTFSAGGGAATAIASGDKTVIVTFTPNAQASPPACTLAVALTANGASTDYGTAWTAQMYTLPTFTTVTTSTSTIESQVDTDVTVNFSGGTLGFPVAAGNVYLKIDSTYFVAKTLTGSTTAGTVIASVKWPTTETRKGVSVVVRYPGETGLVMTDVPGVGTVSGALIDVTASPFMLYVLVPSTITQGTNTIRLAPVNPASPFVAINPVTLKIDSATPINVTSIHGTTGVLTFADSTIGALATGTKSLELFVTKTGGANHTYPAKHTLTVSAAAGPASIISGGETTTLGLTPFNTRGTGTDTYFARTDAVADLEFTFNASLFGTDWKETFLDISVVETGGNGTRSVRATSGLSSLISTTGAKLKFAGYRAGSGCTAVRFDFVTSAATISSTNFSVLTPPTVTGVSITVRDGTAGGTSYVTAPANLVRGDIVRIEFTLSSAVFDMLVANKASVVINNGSGTTVDATDVFANRKFTTADYTIGSAVNHTIVASVLFSGTTSLSLSGFTTELDLLLNGATKIYGTPLDSAALGAASSVWTAPTWSRVGDTLVVRGTYSPLGAPAGKQPDGDVVKVWYQTKNAYLGTWPAATWTLAESARTTVSAAGVVEASVVIPPGAFQIRFFVSVVSRCATPRVMATSAALGSAIATVYAYLPTITVGDSNNYGSGVVFLRGPTSGSSFACLLNLSFAAPSTQLWFPTSGVSLEANHVHSIDCSALLGYATSPKTTLTALNLLSTGLGFTLSNCLGVLAGVATQQTVEIAWKTAGGIQGSTTTITIPAASIKRVPDALSTSAWWTTGNAGSHQLAVSAADAGITVTVEATGDGFVLLSLGSTTLTAGSPSAAEAMSAGTRQTSTTWTVGSVKPTAGATGASDGTVTLTYEHKLSSSTQFLYAYTSVVMIPKAKIYLQPSVVSITKRTIDAALQTALTISVERRTGGDNTDQVPQPTALAIVSVTPSGVGTLAASPTYTAGSGNGAATVVLGYTSPDLDSSVTTLSVTVATPRSASTVLSAPTVTSVTTPSTLAFVNLFTLNAVENYVATTDSGTATLKLTRTGAGLATRFGSGATVAAALGLKYDPQGSNTTINATNFGAGGEFVLPAQAYAAKKLAATMVDTGRVIDRTLATSEIYTFPVIDTSVGTKYTNAAGATVTFLVANNAYKAETTFKDGSSSGRFPLVLVAKVLPTVSTASSVTGTAIASGSTKVTVNFTPTTQATPPVCTALSVELANGATKVYSPSVWTAPMYVMPAIAISGPSSVNPASIVAGVARSVAVTLTAGFVIGSGVTPIVALQIGTDAAVNGTYSAGGVVTATLTPSAGMVDAARAIKVIVYYPAETGIVATEAGAGAVASTTITVAAASYVLDWNTITVDAVTKFWDNKDVGGWAFPSVTASSIKEYKPDRSGEFALVASGATIAQKMFRTTTTQFGAGSSSPVAGITYLLIVENAAYNFSTSTFAGNAVKWTAVGSGITCAVTGTNSYKGKFGVGASEGRYQTNFAVTGGTGLVADLIDKVYVNGVEVDFTGVGSAATRVGPLTKSKGLRGATGGATVATAPGGLSYTDYAMHIKFKVAVTVTITGFGVGANDSASLSHGDATTTFASYPRFGAFNAYGAGATVGGHTLNSIGEFILGTASIITGLDIPMVETAASLGQRLAVAYGMPLDAAAAIAFYAASPRSMTVTDGTVVTPSTTRTVPTTFLTSAMRTASISNTSIPPFAHIGTGWPWAGYKTINGLGGSSGFGTELPSGYFFDPTGSGLPIVANNFTVPSGIANYMMTIRESASNRKYLYFESDAQAFYIGGLRQDGTGLAGTPFASSTSPQFGGTLVDAAPSRDLMTSALSAIRYTAVSWVGSGLRNVSQRGSTLSHNQGFVWNGFYLGGDALSTGLMGIAGTTNKIVWDIAEANGEQPSAWAIGDATYITNAQAPHNVLMWTPLAGTDPADRETMHVFTLVIDNRADPDNSRTLSDALTNSTIRDWVSLYQNGVKLVMSNVNSTNIYTQYSSNSGAKMISHALLTSFRNSTAGAAYAPFTMAGGAPALNGLNPVYGSFSIAENNVQVKSAAGGVAYTAEECTTLTTALALKWGIVPRLSVPANEDILALAYGTASGQTWNGAVRMVRMGFFVSAAAANADLGDASTKDLAWNSALGSGKSALGFLDASTWASNETTVMDDEVRGTISKLSGQRAALSPVWNVTLRNVNAGGFVRLNLKYDNTGGGGLAQAVNVRMGVELAHNGVTYYYALGFSYNGAAKNTADDPFFDSSGNMLANNGVFRLLRSSAASSLSDLLSSVKAKWKNPYTGAMDSKPPPKTIDASAFAMAAVSDGTAAGAGSFVVPYGFTTTGATNVASLKAYYRDVTGEWAPSGTPMSARSGIDKPMLRCDYNDGNSPVLNASASGYAVIIVQAHTWRNNNPSIIWHANVGGAGEIQMCPGGNTYVAPPNSGGTSVVFGAGLNHADSDVVESVQRQTVVSFALAAITGETARWYNGIQGPSGNTTFEAYRTQQPCLGAAGDVTMQDFITVHQFNAPTVARLGTINNNSFTAIGTGTSTTPFFCQTATNKCGGARFGEFTLVPTSMTPEELVSVGADVANRWCVPYAGPTIKKFRIVNVGTPGAGQAAITIGWIGLYKSAFDLGVGTNTNMLALGSASFTVSAGATLSASWSSATIVTTPHQVLPAGAYLEVTVLSAGITVIANCGFIQFGKMITGSAEAKLRLDVQCNASVTAWEPYNLWYHYNGVATEGTTQDCAPLSALSPGTNAYAKDGVFMPWKAKYGKIGAATSPYYLPRYQAALESSATQLQTWSANLMSPTWDCDRAIKYYDSKKSAGTLSANRTLNFENIVGSGQTQTDNSVSKTGQYDLTAGNRMKATKLEYLPIADQRVYGLLFRQTRTGEAENNPHLACMDPLTFTAPMCADLFRGGKIGANTRLRTTITTTPRWYIDVPEGWNNGSRVIRDLQSNTDVNGAHFHGFPRGILHRATRQLFNYAGPDPTIGRIVDTLDSQKMYTVCSWVGNGSPLFSKTTYFGGCGHGEATQILSRGDADGQGLPFQTLVTAQSGGVCTGVTLQNLGKREWDSNGSLSSFVAPQYLALRSCTPHGNFTAYFDATNAAYTSGERLYIVTVVVNTQANGGSFNSDTTLESYVQVYINGKRVNTTTRKSASGSSWTTITTSITPGGSYPAYCYSSSALTYGVTQVNDYTNNTRTHKTKHPMIASTNTSGGASGAGRSIQGVVPGNAVGSNGLRQQYANGSRVILMEVKNECQSTTAYTAAEVAAHIEGLSTKWGLPMAYRWITLSNPAGAPTFRFQRLGFYASHSEAHADSAGTLVDTKTGAFANIMKGYTTTTLNSVDYTIGVVSASGASLAPGVTLTSVLSNTTSAAPTSAQGIEIQAGGSITIDLGDSVTCSHLRFGSFLVTAGQQANVRLTVKVTATAPDSELLGTTYECDLKAAENAAGVTKGQFPLHPGPILTSAQFIADAAGAHTNMSGVYALVPTGDKVAVPAAAAYVAPDTVSGVSFGSPGTLVAFTPLAGCTFKLSKSDFVPSSIGASNVTVHLYDSASAAATAIAGPTKPTPNCTVTSYGFVDGVVTFTATPTTSGNGRRLVVFVDKPAGAGGGLPATVALTDGVDRTVTLPKFEEKAVLLSATSTWPDHFNIKIYDMYVEEAIARTFWDLTLGGGSSTKGFIAKFKDNGDPALIYAGSMIVSDTNQINSDWQQMFFNQGGRVSSKVFEWVRWGYNYKVRPNKLFWKAGNYAHEDQAGSCELWGYTSNDFATGATSLWSGAPGKINRSITLTGGMGNTVGWSHYQVKNTGGGNWAEAGGFLLQS